MLRWLGGVASLAIVLSAPSVVIGAPVDCGSAPTVKCLAAAMFSLAKTLPEDSYFRRHVEFAERELAPGSIKTAMDYELADAPDVAPWEDIDWIAKAGRFDRAIELANQETERAVRLGGLLSVVPYLLDKNDTARASKILDQVERELPSIQASDAGDYASLLPHEVGRLRARLGQIERAARLLSSGPEEASVSDLLEVAKTTPAAASLREQAWREAEKVDEPRVWQLLIEDAVSRDDRADISRAAERAVVKLENADADHSNSAIALAALLLKAGLPQLSAKLVKPWEQWVKSKQTILQTNTVNNLIPVLVELGRDQDVEAAAHYCTTNVLERTGCLGKAAAEYFRLGRSDIATKFDHEALFVATAAPSGEPKQQAVRDLALQNLAITRGGHGDIQGALDAVAKQSNDAKMREVTSYIVRNAINDGYGPVVEPAIEALEQAASTARDVNYLLRAAKGWDDVGNKEGAKRSFTDALKAAMGRQVPLDGDDPGLAAELSWRINGKGRAKAMVSIVDRFPVTNPNAIDHLVEVMKPISPAVAVELAGRQTEVERQIDELAGIGVAIAEGAK